MSVSYRGALFVSIFMLAVSWPACAGGLDGTQWKLKVVPDKQTADKAETEFADTVSFTDGSFSSSALSAKGFKPARYRGDFEEKEAEFEAEQVSATEGVIIWMGEIRGDHIAGSLQWKKKDGANLQFNFTGTKASP